MTLIIAEAGVNHNGSINKAFKLIDAASYAGANVIKFQTFSASNLVTEYAKKAKYQKNNWRSKGTFLNISMYHSATFAIKQFDDNLETPIITPKIVAKNIPITATKIVFKTPTK